MDKKFGATCDLLIAIWTRHDRWLRTEEAGPFRPLYDLIVQRYRKIDVGELNAQKKSKEQRVALGGRGQGYLFLTPPEKGSPVLPLLSFDCCFDPPSAKLRLALFLRHEGGKAAVGFRFESPEGTSSEEGRHDYYHAQLTKAFTKDGPPLPGLPDWLPTSYPALPLSAREPSAVLLGVLLSLYGLKAFKQDFRGEVFWSQFSDTLGDLLAGCDAPL